MDDFTNLTQDTDALANPSGETASDEGQATSPKPTAPKLTPKMKKILIASGSAIVVIVVAVLLVVNLIIVPKQEAAEAAAAEQTRLEQEHQATVDAFTAAVANCDKANQSLDSSISSAQTTMKSDPATLQDPALIDALKTAIPIAQAVPPCTPPTMADDTDTIIQQTSDLLTATQAVTSSKDTLEKATTSVTASIQAKKNAEAAEAARKAAEEAAAKKAEEEQQAKMKELSRTCAVTLSNSAGYSWSVRCKDLNVSASIDETQGKPGNVMVNFHLTGIISVSNTTPGKVAPPPGNFRVIPLWASNPCELAQYNSSDCSSDTLNGVDYWLIKGLEDMIYNNSYGDLPVNASHDFNLNTSMSWEISSSLGQQVSDQLQNSAGFVLVPWNNIPPYRFGSNLGTTDSLK